MMKKVGKGAGEIVAAQPLPAQAEKKPKVRLRFSSLLLLCSNNTPAPSIERVSGTCPHSLCGTHPALSPRPASREACVIICRPRSPPSLPQTVSLTSPPTRILLMRNMVGPGEVDEELEEEARPRSR